MKKIKFDENTIKQIREFIAAEHTLEETCNRFSIKYDTLRRVMYENNIESYNQSKVRSKHVVSEEETEQICTWFRETNMRMEDICVEVKLPNYIVQDIIHQHFSQEFIDKRKSKLYRNSKLGDKNPMTGKFGELHHGYKGVIDDGNGYLMMLKPDWYTGRKAHTYVFLHHIVFCQHSGLTEIPKGFVVHHIDFDKKNNDISNLALMTVAAHARLHAQVNRISKVQRLSHTGVGQETDRSAEQ